jgi:transglutaminase-like putative cysteine protease
MKYKLWLCVVKNTWGQSPPIVAEILYLFQSHHNQRTYTQMVSRLGKRLIGGVLCFFVALPIYAQEQNSVIIEESKDEFLFTKVRAAGGAVKIEERQSTTYLCKDYATMLPIAEVYDDEHSIDKVAVFIDGELNKDIKPNYDYHERSGIFYTDARLCHLVIPFEKKGVNAEVVFDKTINNPIYLLPIYLADELEVKKKTVRILVPEWMTVEIKEMNFGGWSIERSREEMKDGVVYTYTIHNYHPQKPEILSPGPSYYIPQILVLPKESRVGGVVKTYFKTLADQYAWCKGLVDSVSNDDGSVAQKVKEIVVGKTTEEEKVKAIYHWVQQNVRYIAYEDGIAALQPKRAPEVLSKKYGDCKGMAKLLVVMLRSIGLDARHCWLGTNHLAYNHSTPTLCVDNHMIAAWMRNGKPLYLDGTESYIRFGETAERIQGREILVENGNSYFLEHVPTAHHEQNTATEHRNLHVEGEDLVGNVTHIFRGESRELVLAVINSIKQDQRDETLSKLFCGGNTNYLITNLKLSDINSYEDDLKVTYDLVHKGAITRFGGESYIDLDNRKHFAQYKFDTAKRHLPICFPYKDHQALDVIISLPSGTKVKTLPASIAITTADYGYAGSWTQKERILSYHSESWREKTTFSLTEIMGLNKDIAAVQKFYNIQPELTF